MATTETEVTPLTEADRALIEAEHHRLEQMLNDLCSTCCHFLSKLDCVHCNHETMATCQGRLPSFLFDFHDFVSEHIDNEESIMEHTLPADEFGDYLKAHQKEHVQLLREVRDMIDDAYRLGRQGNVAAAIRQFHALITERFSEHARNFDSILLHATPH